MSPPVASFTNKYQPRSGHGLVTWWRHQMETSSPLLSFCPENSPVTVEFPAQKPVTWSFGVFFDLCLNKGLINYRDAGDLRRHGAHYDVTVINHNHKCSPPFDIRYFLNIECPNGRICLFDHTISMLQPDHKCRIRKTITFRQMAWGTFIYPDKKPGTTETIH